MVDTNLADQIARQTQRSMEAMTRDVPRPVLSKAAKEEMIRNAQADRVLRAPITKGRDVRQFHGFSMRVDHERYSPWPGGQHGGDGGFKLCLNRPTREPRPAPAEPHDDDDDEWAGDNAGPRPWDSHAKLLSAKDQRRRTNGGPLRPSSAPMRPERRSGSSNEPWIGWSPDPGKRVLPNPAWAPVDVQGTTQRIRAMRHVERARGRRRQVWHNCVLCGGIHDDGTGCSEPLTISAHWPRVPRGLD